MTLDTQIIPSPSQAKTYREKQIDGLVNAALERLATKMRPHDFDVRPLVLRYGEIISSYPELSQFDGINIIIKVLRSKGWHTKIESRANEDYLYISATSLITLSEA